MPIGTKVGLSLGDIVLDRDPAPSPLKGHSPNFQPMSFVAKRLDGLRCHLVRRLALAQATVFDGDPAPIIIKGTAPTQFLSMSVVAKQLYGLRCNLVRRMGSQLPP